MIGKTLLHYEINSKLGAGGMGVVYEAKDTKLDRIVAIKFLPPQVAASEDDRKRFEIEAKAAAALNHPNIATIHAIEEVDDTVFIVMEHIDGRELREIIRSGRPDLQSAIDYALQIAKGLQAAHNNGIVHRDIKSANIMITDDGRVKIMDFGLAKVGGGELVTKAASTLGTAAYMSPEQAHGEEAGNQSDIWSFGVVLYEMLTGQLPFTGEYEQVILYAILNENYTPISELTADVPPQLVQVVAKALQKDPKERYNSLAEVLADLQSDTLDPATAESSEKSIVVLPFKNMSPDPDNEYFSDGLTEEVISDLSNVAAIRVISRTSAMQLKGTEKSIKIIGRDLGVQFVLEGSVRKVGNNLRITAQLIDVARDANLWSDKYSGTIDDIFDIQEKVSQSIVDALRLKLTAEEKDKLEARPMEDARAYDYYFQARQEILKMTESGLQKALELIAHSQHIVGENVLLLFAEGFIHWQYFNSGVESEEKHLDAAEACAKQILQIEPESVHGYRLFGLSQVHRKNIRAGIDNLKKVLQMDQNDPDALTFISILLALTGETEASRQYGKRLVQVDPLTPYIYTIISQAPYYEGKFSEAEIGAKKAIELDPSTSVFRVWYLVVIAPIWEKERTIAYHEEFIAPMEKSFFTDLALLMTYALKGEGGQAEEVLTEDFKNAARNDVQYSVFVADALALLGRKEEAVGWLENAFTRGFCNYPFLAEYNPFLRILDEDAGFQELLLKVKAKWERRMVAE